MESGDHSSNSHSNYNSNNTSHGANNYNYHSNNYSNSQVNRSQRSDGSYRPAVRPPRPGYAPPGESGRYVPPPKRSETPSIINDEEREVSWADEDAPIVKEISASECASENEFFEETVKEAVKEAKKEASEESEKEAEKECEVEKSDANSAPTKRVPSKLATAIDDALDSLSLGDTSYDGGSASERPTMGRFATQIARDERNGYTIGSTSGSGYGSGSGSGYQRYNNRYNDRNNDRNNEYSPRNEYSRDNSSRNEYSRDNSSRNDYSRDYSRDNNREFSQRGFHQQRYSQEGECPKLKACFESLSKLRREMAVINAKLEYIRYMVAHKESEEMTDVERERVDQESALITRMNAIYEEIATLN